ncbi:hypothetical protein [Limnohabitans sp.]|uniref:hypothetical protein n=1 Tax=Limnohabitans sp. TaxID=1907725 RepID=UPI00286F9464|nr:hypothetical protein [Limnohabitans sp.]
MNTLLKRLRFVVALFFTVALVACASGPKQVFHSFQFDGKSDVNKWDEKIDLLAYSYGDKYLKLSDSLDNPNYPGVHKGKTALPSRSSVSGPMPIGEFLYVKWRIKATGEVLEDRVDLRERLPKNMTNHDLTFSIDQKQLHVYVVTPFPRNPKDEKEIVPKYPHINFYKPTHLTWLSASGMTYEIYPALEPYPNPTHLTPKQVEKCLRGEFLCAVDKPKK